MNQRTFWQRVGDFFRPETTLNRIANGDRLTSFSTDLGPLGPADDRPSGSWWSRRSGRAAHSREALTRMSELLDSLDTHFRKQDERAEQLGTAVNRLAETLGALADAQRDQGEQVRTIAEHANTSSRHQAALSESLSRVPASLHAQTEAVRAMVRQMEIAQDADTHMFESMRKLGEAVSNLNQSANSQVETLRRINAAEREQKASLIALVRDQGRRFLIVTLVSAVIGLAALTAVGLLLWERAVA
jgi:chromosome segregation ATPase